MRKSQRLLVLSILMIAATTTAFLLLARRLDTKPRFDGERAYQDVLAQDAFGPRTPGSAAHAQARAYFLRELEKAGWQAEALPASIEGHLAYNILATRQKTPKILLVAHYDSRLAANADPDPANQNKPVPGANDGASGVAVLLELARALPADSVAAGILLVDIEDQGRLPGWDWILGSRAFVRDMTFTPRAVILVDMIGDADLNIYQERNSDPALTASIWAKAKRLGYESVFIPEPKYQVIDDHVPFIEKGIPAVDLIDLDYPYWHTVEDTPDKVSAQSLQTVGDVLLAWLLEQGDD
jgi:Zn-dependent M28 family amino/carboxypeptidase